MVRCCQVFCVFLYHLIVRCCPLQLGRGRYNFDKSYLLRICYQFKYFVCFCTIVVGTILTNSHIYRVFVTNSSILCVFVPSHSKMLPICITTRALQLTYGRYNFDKFSYLLVGTILTNSRITTVGTILTNSCVFVTNSSILCVFVPSHGKMFPIRITTNLHIYCGYSRYNFDKFSYLLRICYQFKYFVCFCTMSW